MILLVSYDLRGPHDYTAFYEILKLQGTWWHYLTSTWLVSTTKTPTEVYNSIAPHMLKNDSVLVIEVGKAYNGWLPEKAWEWIQQQQTASVLNPFLVPPGPPLSGPPATNIPLGDILTGMQRKNLR